MSPSPLFICQNNSNLPRNQHIQLSNSDSQQDFAFKNNKEEDLMTSLLCSSSSSNLLVKKEELVVAKEAFDDEDDQNAGYRTPSSPESRIPAAVHCPPAPKKPKLCRRRVARRCSEGQRIAFLEGIGLVVFEEVSCHRRRRRQSVRGRLAIASATEIGK